VVTHGDVIIALLLEAIQEIVADPVGRCEREWETVSNRDFLRNLSTYRIASGS